MYKLQSITMAALAIVCLPAVFQVKAQAAEPLQLVNKFDMPAAVHGKFDHLGVDLQGNRLFAAAESAHQVLVFDLRSGKFIRSIDGIQIPHAIFVRHDLNRIYVTDGGAGTLNVYNGTTYALLKSIPLKVDADSIGYDPATHLLYIDNGGGDAHESFSMLSVVDTLQAKKVADMKIDGDTLEAMALEASSSRMYVNNAAENKIAVVNRKTLTLEASWPVTMGKRNVAMALDEASHRLYVACRSGVIVVINTQTGKELQTLPIGKGVDDLTFDPASKRLYAPCGADGLVYVYQQQTPDHYVLLGKVPSGPAGKNGLLVKSLDRYFVILPPQETSSGSINAYAVR